MRGHSPASGNRHAVCKDKCAKSVRHSPASIVRKPAAQNGAASIVREPSQQTAYRHRKGSPVCRRAFSVCATSPYGVAGHAKRGLRPQGAPRRRGGTPPRAGTGAPPTRTSAGGLSGTPPRASSASLLYRAVPRASSAAGHAERGLRPQGAPAPQRGHSPASGNRLRGNNEAREREPVRRYSEY